MKISYKTPVISCVCLLGAGLLVLGQTGIGLTLRQFFPFAPTGTSAQTEAGPRQDYATRIADLISARDLGGLVKIHDELDRTWQGKFAVKARLISQIIDALSTYDFEDPLQYKYSVDFADELLTRADELTVSMEAQLVGKLESTYSETRSPKAPAEWTIERKNRLLALLHLYRRVSNGIDPGFDPNNPADQPVGNATAPGHYPAGTDPKAISEPDLRTQYETAIEVNRLKAERYTTQTELRDVQRRLPDLIEKVLTNLFSVPPFDRKELDMEIRLFNLDEKKGDRIRSLTPKD